MTKFNFQKLSIFSGAVALALSISPSVLAASFADFIFVVDESGSMGGEQAWLGSVINDLDAGLAAENVTARYGLVGFGNFGGDRDGNGLNDVLGRKVSVGGADFGNAAQFSAATNTLLTSGGFEDGYSAIDFSFSNYSLNPNAAVNIVLVTDEDRDNGNNSLDTANILNQLQTNGALLNAVVNNPFTDNNGTQAIGIDSKDNAYLQNGTNFIQSPGANIGGGFGSTASDYVQLALDSGGAAWNLNFLRRGGDAATAFSKAFVDIKVQEVVDQNPTDPVSTPEPASLLALLAVGAFGANSTLKSKKAVS